MSELSSLVSISLATLLIAHLFGTVAPILGPWSDRAKNALTHGAAIVACAAGAAIGIGGLFTAEPLVFSLPSTLPLLHIQLRLDPLAAFFVVTIALCGLGASIYALGYAREFYGRRSIAVLGALYHAFLLSMTLVVMADDALLFLIVWELMSLASYGLVVTEHDDPRTRDAGFFYLVMTHVGTAALIIAYVALYHHAGSLAFDAFRQPADAFPDELRTFVFLAVLVGFGVKAGVVPLHLWLPAAHPAATSHVSALMSGVMIKTAIYGLIRVVFDFLGGAFPWWWGVAVLAIGAVSALLGVMYALMENDLKSLLAYSSVENIGIILLGVGAGMVFQTFGLTHLAGLGLLAALYHVINHAMFKGLLFLGAGAVAFSTHTRNMEQYGGLIRAMPWTAFLVLIGAASIAGLPPTNGFVSEWMTFQSLFLGFGVPDLLLKILMPIAAAMLALTGALAVACFAKAYGLSFLAMPRSAAAKHAIEVPPAMRLGMGWLAACCLGLGVAPMIVVSAIDRVTTGLIGMPISAHMVTTGGLALAPGLGIGFASVSTPVLWLLLAGIVVLALVGARALGGPLLARRYRTWACGIPPKPRMEYTATGFIQPIRQVFSTVYRPTVKLETDLVETSRYVARRMRFEVHIESTFQKYLYDPVVEAFAALAERLRVLQPGSLHLYLLYIFLTLLALLLWVV
ncbi:MAG: hydrogenase 4 subunit B [Nitrospirota bacterium]